MDRRTLLKLMATHALLSAGRPSSALANPDSIHTGTWINLTTIIEHYRDQDYRKRFIVKIGKRENVVEDAAKTVIFIAKK